MPSTRVSHFTCVLETSPLPVGSIATPSLPAAAVVGVEQAAAEDRRGLRSRRLARPEDVAGRRVDALNAAGVVDQLELVLDANQRRRGHRVALLGLLFPFDLAGLLVEGAQPQVLQAGDDDGVLVKDGAAAHAAINVLAGAATPRARRSCHRNRGPPIRRSRRERRRACHPWLASARRSRDRSYRRRSCPRA